MRCTIRNPRRCGWPWRYSPASFLTWRRSSAPSAPFVSTGRWRRSLPLSTRAGGSSGPVGPEVEVVKGRVLVDVHHTASEPVRHGDSAGRPGNGASLDPSPGRDAHRVDRGVCTLPSTFSGGSRPRHPRCDHGPAGPRAHLRSIESWCRGSAPIWSQSCRLSLDAPVAITLSPGSRGRRPG